MVYPSLLPLMRTHRLPVINLTDAPADLNGLFRFAERRNLVSTRVPSHYNWPLQPRTYTSVFHAKNSVLSQGGCVGTELVLSLQYELCVNNWLNLSHHLNVLNSNISC